MKTIHFLTTGSGGGTKATTKTPVKKTPVKKKPVKKTPVKKKPAIKRK